MRSGAVCEELASFYRRYNARCNAHEFGTLGEFLAEGVVVNSRVQGLRAYVEGLEAEVRAFPDYRWDLRHLLVTAAGSRRTSATPAPTAVTSSRML